MKTGTIISNEHMQAAHPIVSGTRLTIVFIICFLSTFFSGISSMLMSVYLPVAVKDLLGAVTEEKMNDVSAWINALFIFGWMFGGLTWGIICDKIGRSKSVVLSTACFGLFTVLTAVSSTWFQVSMCRLVCGRAVRQGVAAAGGARCTCPVCAEPGRALVDRLGWWAMAGGGHACVGFSGWAGLVHYLPEFPNDWPKETLQIGYRQGASSCILK